MGNYAETPKGRNTSVRNNGGKDSPNMGHDSQVKLRLEYPMMRLKMPPRSRAEQDPGDHLSLLLGPWGN